MTIKQLKVKVKRLKKRLQQAEQALHWARINLLEAQNELAVQMLPLPTKQEK